MTTISGFPGFNGLAFINTGLGVLRTAMGASDGQVCSSPTSCYVEGDGNEGGGSLRMVLDHRPDSEQLLGVNRPSITAAFSRGGPNERDVRAVEFIQNELFQVCDLTSGSLGAAVDRAIRGLEIENLWLSGKIFPHLEDKPYSTRTEINTLITDIRERKRRPAFQAYAAAVARFEEAASSLTSLRQRFVAANKTFPPEELRELIEAVWQANERARLLDQEANVFRQAVMDDWRDG